MGQVFNGQLQRLIVHIRPHAEPYIFQRHIIFRRLILPQDIAPHRQSDYLGISRRYGCNTAVLGIGIHAAFLGKLCRLLPFRIKYAELRAFKLLALLVNLCELNPCLMVLRLMDCRNINIIRAVCLDLNGVRFRVYCVPCRWLKLGDQVFALFRHLHRNGTVFARHRLDIEAPSAHGKPCPRKADFGIVLIHLDYPQRIPALYICYGDRYILNLGNRSILSLLRYVKRTLRIVQFVPLRCTALYRHIAAVGYAGFNGFAAAIGYQRINWIFPVRIPRGVYFKLRSEQGLAVFIGLLYRQRAGLGRIFHGYGVAPVRRDLEGYKLLVQFIALRSYRLLQIISAQRQRYRIGAAVQSGYRFVLYGILILIQHLKCRAVQGFVPVGAYLFNGELLLRPGIRPGVGGVAYGYAVRRCAADAHIIRLIAARIALRRYYLRKLIHAIRHVLKADPPLIVGNGIHLLDGGIRRAAFLYKLQLEQRPCEAIARAVGFGEFDLFLFAPVFQLKLNRFVMVFGVHRNHFAFYTHYALRDVCFTEIIRAPEQTANEYLATFICNKLGAFILKAVIGIPAFTSSRRNKPACAVFQRKLYSFQQLAVFVSLDYFQPGLYLSVVYADPRFAVFYLEILARRYDHVPFWGFYFFQNVFAQGEVFKGKGTVLAGDYRGRIFFFIGKRSKACPIDLYILPVGALDYKLCAGKRRFFVLGKFCDGELRPFVYNIPDLYDASIAAIALYFNVNAAGRNIPLWRFCLRDSIPSKWKALKFYHTILPACGFLGYAVAADLKLNAFKQLPIVALLRQFERVLFQLICYCFFAIPRSFFTVTYNESVNFIAQRIPIGRGNFLQIVGAGGKVVKFCHTLPIGNCGLRIIIC